MNNNCIKIHLCFSVNYNIIKSVKVKGQKGLFRNFFWKNLFKGAFFVSFKTNKDLFYFSKQGEEYESTTYCQRRSTGI